MTVEELIAALSLHDPKAQVVIPHEWDSHQREVVTSVETQRVQRRPGYVGVDDDGPETVVSIS